MIHRPIDQNKHWFFDICVMLSDSSRFEGGTNLKVAVHEIKSKYFQNQIWLFVSDFKANLPFSSINLLFFCVQRKFIDLVTKH